MRSRLLRNLALLILVSVTIAGPAWALADAGPPAEGGVFPDIKLPIPHRSEERNYLGITGDGTFKIPQTRARIVVVEIFSMYCPFCQKEAPVVNELFQLIDESPELREKVKIIGIGAGNSTYEVNAFRNLYRIAFPLFSDANYSLHNVLGKVSTPYFIVVRLDPKGTHKVIYSKVGSFGDPKQFLDLILKKSEAAARPKKGA